MKSDMTWGWFLVSVMLCCEFGGVGGVGELHGLDRRS